MMIGVKKISFRIKKYAIQIMRENQKVYNLHDDDRTKQYTLESSVDNEESLYPTFIACWVFECLHHPPNSDMDHRIFNVCKWSFCMRIHND